MLSTVVVSTKAGTKRSGILRSLMQGIMVMIMLSAYSVSAAQKEQGHSHSHAHSHEHSASNAESGVQLLNASVRATKPGMSSSAAYMVIRNNSHKAVAIQSLASPVAMKTELHTTEMNNGMMKMRRVDNLKIKPDDEVMLKPGGYHVMLMGLKQPIEANSKVPVTLTFSNGEKKTVLAHAMDEVKGQHMAH